MQPDVVAILGKTKGVCGREWGVGLVGAAFVYSRNMSSFLLVIP